MDQERTPADANSSDGFSAALEGILSNPDMLSMISSVAKNLKAASSESNDVPKNEGNDAAPTTDTSATLTSSKDISALMGNIAPLLSASSKGGSKKDDDRACLLRALKPYLSNSRSEAIDYIIKFSVLAKALKNLS
jgi:hypothetical protein